LGAGAPPRPGWVRAVMRQCVEGSTELAGAGWGRQGGGSGHRGRGLAVQLCCCGCARLHGVLMRLHGGCCAAGAVAAAVDRDQLLSCSTAASMGPAVCVRARHAVQTAACQSGVSFCTSTGSIPVVKQKDAPLRAAVCSVPACARLVEQFGRRCSVWATTWRRRRRYGVLQCKKQHVDDDARSLLAHCNHPTAARHSTAPHIAAVRCCLETRHLPPLQLSRLCCRRRDCCCCRGCAGRLHGLRECTLLLPPTQVLLLLAWVEAANHSPSAGSSECAAAETDLQRVCAPHAQSLTKVLGPLLKQGVGLLLGGGLQQGTEGREPCECKQTAQMRCCC
jgi:hypothetical protein